MENQKAGKLYLIPTSLGEGNLTDVIPSNVLEVINSVNYYIVENVRTARRFLSKAGIKADISGLNFFELNKHTNPDTIATFLAPIKEGNNVGIISEAGCPAVADPGAAVVELAHNRNIHIVPLVGPSSILLSLMASGMNGQSFSFVGYLPIEKAERIKQLRLLENRSSAENQTQIFIEAPYRNMQIMDDIVNNCSPETKFCIAVNLTTDTEYVKTKTVGEWKGRLPEIHKQPAIFLIHKPSIAMFEKPKQHRKRKYQK